MLVVYGAEERSRSSRLYSDPIGPVRVHLGKSQVHVDDGLCCGSEMFQQKLQALAERFPFGSHKKRNFTFTGLRIDQQPDSSIHISQTQYIKDINPISISRNRKGEQWWTSQWIYEEERQALRGLIGSLQYAAMSSRLDVCNRLGHLQSPINKAKISTLTEANKTLHEAKIHANVTIKIQPISLENLRLYCIFGCFICHRKSTGLPSGHDHHAMPQGLGYQSHQCGQSNFVAFQENLESSSGYPFSRSHGIGRSRRYVVMGSSLLGIG